MYPPTVSDVPVHMVYPKGFPPERQLAIGQELFGIVPGLTMYATLWLREHNRVCDVLKAEHPTWDDEQLFQTTRLIIIGESQARAMLHCCSPAHMLWLLYFYLFTIYQAHYCVLQQSQKMKSNHNSFNGKLQHNIVKKTQINPSHATVSIFKVWCCSFSSISTAYWILTLLLLHQYRVSRVPIVLHWTICAAGNCINLLFVPEINV